LLGKPGDHIKVGQALVDFEEGPHADTGTVMGVLPEPPAKPAAAPPAAAPAPAPAPAATAARPAAAARGNGSAAAARVQASPAVRALARERGIDLARVHGTGPDGIVSRADLEHFASAPPATTALEPLRGIRRAMAENMTRARASVVAATLWDEADIDAWFASDHDVTTRLVHAVVAACASVPVLNAWFDDSAMAMGLQFHPRVDLGIAVDTPDGLIVPVLRDAAALDSERIRSDVNALKKAALARTVTVADLRDPTITLSNFGTLAGRQAALAILPPQVAIVGAGRISLVAVPNEGGGVAFRHHLPLSVTFDHRVATGGDAARFMNALIGSLQTATGARAPA
jgi:pyruvate dehydrogenase E2 component (dihydrolipoamide acetyltransferase)